MLGVGEGTTEHIQEFIKHSGIDEDEFVPLMNIYILFYHIIQKNNVSPHHNMSMPIGGLNVLSML